MLELMNVDVIYTMDRLTAKTKIFLKIPESNAAIIMPLPAILPAVLPAIPYTASYYDNDIMHQRYAG